ncbi:unnamed protein product [Orchesella dallaii]|uniref:Secreted protein n=1 Tax=Orchesella dallaii TaxID=48710 RepID=A0ABP1RX06_9HEXA
MSFSLFILHLFFPLAFLTEINSIIISLSLFGSGNFNRSVITKRYMHIDSVHVNNVCDFEGLVCRVTRENSLEITMMLHTPAAAPFLEQKCLKIVISFSPH